MLKVLALSEPNDEMEITYVQASDVLNLAFKNAEQSRLVLFKLNLIEFDSMPDLDLENTLHAKIMCIKYKTNQFTLVLNDQCFLHRV